MTQKQAIKLWQDGAKDALETAQSLFTAKKYHFCLFFCQLSLEKALKAKFIKINDTAPPYTHNLALLAKKVGLKPTKTQLRQLKELTEFNLEARYPQEKQQLYRKATLKYTFTWFQVTKKLLQWINQ